MANGSLSTQQSGEGEIRKAIVQADLVDCIVALSGQLFYTTQIPVCLWFLAKDRSAAGGFRDRRGEVLFVDARSMGQLVTRVHRVLSDQEISRIAATYHAWRGEPEAGEYTDVPAFCRSTPLVEITSNESVLTPGRYVGSLTSDFNDSPDVEKLSTILRDQIAESQQQQTVVLQLLAGLSRGE